MQHITNPYLFSFFLKNKNYNKIVIGIKRYQRKFIPPKCVYYCDYFSFNVSFSQFTTFTKHKMLLVLRETVILTVLHLKVEHNCSCHSDLQCVVIRTIALLW